MNTPIIQSYFENPARPGTFDCVYTPDPLNIPYFKLSTPRNERFKAQGAVKMIETWTREGKPLFSGLVPLKPIENIFFGNRLEPNGKKSLICLVYHEKFFQDSNLIQLRYYKNFCPRSKALQRKFLLDILKYEIQTGLHEIQPVR